jgi:formylglycine-generating enzyme required for sulfatase activity
LPDYYIGRTPVTNAQYRAFVQATGHRAPPHWHNGQIPEGEENYPVVCVSWYDALAYCEWLAKITGRAYRLPTEAEWEKAARGSDGRIYPWSDGWAAEKCNSEEGDRWSTAPVGAYPQGASPYGVLDMAGNVWEWTSSLYKAYPYRADDGREDPDADGRRVVRGGSFYDSRYHARCACRSGPSDDYASVNLGFRVCVSPSRSGL